MPIDVIVIVSPKPGKEPRIHELADYLVNSVKAHEPDVSEYQAYRTTGDEEGTVDYVMYFK
jgi:hypothetical protein